MHTNHSISFITGGVTAPKGFTAAGVHCGIRKNKTKEDLAFILSDTRANAAAVYTQNLVKGAPLLVTQQNLADGTAQAVICNSGNANTCNANGIAIANAMCALVKETFSVSENDVIVASTGVIGQPLDIEPIALGMPLLQATMGKDGGSAARAIMTTDTFQKEAAVSFLLGGKVCKLGGIAKGSGMIHPNMATLLVFLTTDAAISSALLQEALSADVKNSFNMVSVDGDTSTNDMCAVLANGAAGNPAITEKNEDYFTFTKALAAVTEALCKMIAKDGEGATRLIVCDVTGGKDEMSAKLAAKSVITSSLFKAAIFGADANWGRVLCALGYSGAALDIGKIDVTFSSPAGEIAVCKNGAGIPFSEATAKTVLTETEITVHIALNDGTATATAWGCDLTYDYVRINGDYRT